MGVAGARCTAGPCSRGWPPRRGVSALAVWSTGSGSRCQSHRLQSSTRYRWVCVCVRACVRVRVHVWYVCVHACACMCVCMHVRACVCACVCVHACACMRVCACICVHVCSCVCVCMHVRACVCVCVHTQACTMELIDKTITIQKFCFVNQTMQYTFAETMLLLRHQSLYVCCGITLSGSL